MAEEYLGNNAHFLELDLSKPASVLQFVKQINTNFSEIDVLYNNAGLIYRDFDTESTVKESKTLMSTIISNPTTTIKTEQIEIITAVGGG